MLAARGGPGAVCGPSRPVQMERVGRGEGQDRGRGHHAQRGDEAAGRGTHGEGPAFAAVFGVPPLAQLRRQ